MPYRFLSTTLLALLVASLTGCAVVGVAGAAVGVAGAAVGTAASVAGTVVSTTVSVTGGVVKAGARAVTGDAKP